MQTRKLWGEAPHNRTRTSIAAADSVRTSSGTRRSVVLAALRSWGPMTQDAIALALGWPIQSVNPRINELAKAGVIRDTGEVRRTQAGRNAVVWEATP